jgi:hypothetical protein
VKTSATLDEARATTTPRVAKVSFFHRLDRRDGSASFGSPKETLVELDAVEVERESPLRAALRI